MLGNCYIFAGGVKKELVFAGTEFLQKGITGKLPMEKKEQGKEFLFLQKLGSNSPGFLELESQKKGMQKRMHNLAPMMKPCLRWEPTLSLVGTWELCMFVHTLGRLLES